MKLVIVFLFFIKETKTGSKKERRAAVNAGKDKKPAEKKVAVTQGPKVNSTAKPEPKVKVKNGRKKKTYKN